MYLVIDKKTRTILHMSNSFPREDKKPKDVFPAFDPATMDFGRSQEQYVPARFVIENGVIKDLESSAPTPPESLTEARERILREFSETSLELRKRLIPDYQVLNAGIGLYDEKRIELIRQTIEKFREEFHRLEKEVAKAQSIKELEAITPHFPMPTPKVKPDPKKKS